MIHTAIRPGFVVVLAAAAALAFTLPGEASQRAPAPSSGRAVSAEQVQAGSVPLIREETNAERTREKLDETLSNYPPALGRVLKLDPSLLNSAEYLQPYPALAAFVAQHPEIAHNPGFFFEHINVNSGYLMDGRSRDKQQFYNMIGNFGAFLVFLVITAVLIWLIRMIVAHRRWNRVWKVQFETHAKLLDRLTSNDDLLAYVQTPAGRRFLESAPMPLQDAPAMPAMSAPFSRILWSVQAGVVLTIAGFGLLYVSTRLIDEPSQFFMVVGVVTVALGGGFIVSALAAYLLSRKLGLLERPAADHA